jgi:hypothetical protein
MINDAAMILEFYALPVTEISDMVLKKVPASPKFGLQACLI